MIDALIGDLKYFKIEEILYFLSRFKKTGRLLISNSSIYFQDGNITHAQDNDLNGEDALFNIVMKEQGNFKFIIDEKPELITINEQLHKIFEEIERRRQEVEEVKKSLPPLDTIPYKSSSPEGKVKIEMNKVHWKLLISVDGKRTLLDIIEASSLEKGTAMRALKYLFEEGLIFDPKARERIISIWTAKINKFFELFTGEKIWSDIINEMMNKYNLEGFVEVRDNKIVVLKSDLPVSTNKLEEWFKETLNNLKIKAENVLGKIIVNKKWKVIDDTQ